MVTSITTPVDKADKGVTTTKISDLPNNLVEEILSKIPLKYMRPVRLTCKEWDTLSKSRSFSKMHIDKLNAVSECESTIIALVDYKICLMRVVLVDNEVPIVEFTGKINKKIEISKVFHCDGLLLCVLKDDYSKVVVWNPYLGQTRSIECRYSHRPNGLDGPFVYALGYEDKGSSCRSYKFLRFIDKYSLFELYDFDSSSWKTLDVTPHWRIQYYQLGVTLKGNTYWPASQRSTKLEDHIICFDFASESFGPLLRLLFDDGYGDFVTFSCVREEKLAVLLAHNEVCPPEFEIWITTKIEAEEVLWSKFLRVVEMELDPLITVDSFFIVEENKVAMAFEEDYLTFDIFGEDGYLKKLELGERLVRYRYRNWSANVSSYVPGLVQIKQPASGGGSKETTKQTHKSKEK